VVATTACVVVEASSDDVARVSGACSPSASGASLTTSSEVSLATNAFLDAYARGDEVTADTLASPLYRAEWERRGLSAEERTQLAWTDRKLSDGNGSLLPDRFHFTFVGGVSDANGFGKLLFVPRSARTDQPSLSSTWRVDVDPGGKVVWLELVWLFASDVRAVRPVLDPRELARVKPAFSGVQPLLGVASDDGSEAYYVYSLTRSPSQTTSCVHTVVGFYALDDSGQVRPGAWTYGAGQHGLVEYGKPRQAQQAHRVEPDYQSLLSDYLQTLD
jgi:hypothetical protein